MNHPDSDIDLDFPQETVRTRRELVSKTPIVLGAIHSLGITKITKEHIDPITLEVRKSYEESHISDGQIGLIVMRAISDQKKSGKGNENQDEG